MNEDIKSKTDFLFTSPSILRSIGSIFNLAGNYFEYNVSQSSEEADRRALMADFKTVGFDFQAAEKKFRKLHNKQLDIDFE